MKRFIMKDQKGEKVVGAVLTEDNVYISTYGKVEKGCKRPVDLEVGETTRKVYALSGQKPTTYWITRVEDE